MYFYKLLASGYEEHYETIYYSDKKYTQEEFEDIVFDLFEEFCKQLIEQEPESVCYPNIHFTFGDVFWDYENNFKKMYICNYDFNHDTIKKDSDF